jgi:hypothetical protein
LGFDFQADLGRRNEQQEQDQHRQDSGGEDAQAHKGMMAPGGLRQFQAGAPQAEVRAGTHPLQARPPRRRWPVVLLGLGSIAEDGDAQRRGGAAHARRAGRQRQAGALGSRLTLKQAQVKRALQDMSAPGIDQQETLGPAQVILSRTETTSSCSSNWMMCVFTVPIITCKRRLRSRQDEP